MDRKIILIGLLISVALIIFLSPFASKFPDGLEKVAEDKRFLEKGEGKEVFKSPLPDYTVPHVKNEKISTSIAGLIGILFVFCITFVIGYFIKK